MKNSLFFFVLLFLSFSSYSQTLLNLKIRFNDSLEVDKYEPENNGFKYQYIRTQPGEYLFDNPAALRIMNGETITQVDLVYSDYPKGQDFSELNKNRILELYMHCPNAFNKQTIQWKKIKQSGVRNANEMNHFFHGFVIYYRPFLDYSTEQKYFKDVINGKQKLQDSTIFKILNRNKSWKEMVCVADVTGSMSPYTIQLLVWAKFNEKQKTFKQFVFFNDDDAKSNDQSKSLDTSGIWSLESFKAEKVMDQMLLSMQKGGHIENDLEAILYAHKKFPKNIKNLVLIADNWEDPCDMQLLLKIKELGIPVKVIVCGVNKVLNTKYLELAYHTNGSIHTLEEDLIDMAKINEGKIFIFSGMKFKMQGGKFLKIS